MYVTLRSHSMWKVHFLFWQRLFYMVFSMIVHRGLFVVLNWLSYPEWKGLCLLGLIVYMERWRDKVSCTFYLFLSACSFYLPRYIIDPGYHKLVVQWCFKIVYFNYLRNFYVYFYLSLPHLNNHNSLSNECSINWEIKPIKIKQYI